jgi:hypothetical protein
LCRSSKWQQLRKMLSPHLSTANPTLVRWCGSLRAEVKSQIFQGVIENRLPPLVIQSSLDTLTHTSFLFNGAPAFQLYTGSWTPQSPQVPSQTALTSMLLTAKTAPEWTQGPGTAVSLFHLISLTPKHHSPSDSSAKPAAWLHVHTNVSSSSWG